MPKAKLAKPRYWLLKALVGLGLVVLFAYSLGDYIAFEHVAVHAKAKVESVTLQSLPTGRRGNRLTVYRPEVVFAVGGARPQEVEALAKVTTRETFKKDEEIEVEYDPSHPKETVRVASGMSLLNFVVGLGGLTLLGFGISDRVRWARYLRDLATSDALEAAMTLKTAEIAEPSQTVTG